MSGRRAWVSPVLLPALLALEAIIEAVFGAPNARIRRMLRGVC
jgi:hypothetical protein